MSNKLPKGWKWVKMGDIVTLSSLKHSPIKPEDLFYIGLEHIEKHTGKLTSKVGLDKITTIKNKFSKGDILYGKLRPNLNKVYLSKEEGVCSTDILVLKLSNECVGKYLHPIMFSTSFVNKMSDNTSGVNLPRVPTKFILNYEIPLPPIETQHAIVSKIEELFSELDKGIEDLKTAQLQLKTYRQAVLKYAFEGKLTNKKVKEGELPKGWEWTNIKEITTLLGDGLHGTPKYDTNGEYYFINGNNLNDGKIEIKENTKKVSKEEFDKYKKQLNDKTIFVSINGSLGYTAFYNDEPVILGKSACYFNVKEGIDKHYIRYIFTSQRFTNYSTTVATGSTIKNVSLKSMREFEIPLPINIEEQQLIVQEIESRLSVADKMEESIVQSLLQAEALRQSILKKAFSGELV
jgi:type I restriction enzyme S subunit